MTVLDPCCWAGFSLVTAGGPPCGALAAHRSGFSYCGAQAQGSQASVVTALFFFKKTFFLTLNFLFCIEV